MEKINFTRINNDVNGKPRYIKLEIQLDEDSLLNAVYELTNEQKADLAIRFGENGDFSYEFILLDKLLDFISKQFEDESVLINNFKNKMIKYGQL